MAKMFSLQDPVSFGTFEDYKAAQQLVDTLSDRGFAVQHVLVVGTDLKQLERVTGRLTWSKVLAGGAAGGGWTGVLIGLLIGFVIPGQSLTAPLLVGLAMGILGGLVASAVGYRATGGKRDFSSVRIVEPTRFEVLIESEHAEAARLLLDESAR